MGPSSRPIRQPGHVEHLAIGDMVVSAVNDGVHLVSFDDLVTEERTASERAHAGQFRRTPPWLTINCFLIRSGDKVALVDAGFSTKTELVGKLVENLASVGVGAADIDMVLMTHLHPDHEAGLIDAAGKAVFSNAEIVAHENELAYWRDDGALSRASAEAKGDFLLARQCLAAYEGRVSPAAAGEVMPGVRAFPTPGHTPGHTAWLIESGGDALLLWGDIVHFPGIQFALPETSVAWDIDSAAAAVARRKVLAFAAAEKLRIGGVHLDFPTFGHVAPDGRAYRHIPEVWRPSV